MRFGPSKRSHRSRVLGAGQPLANKVRVESQNFANVLERKRPVRVRRGQPGLGCVVFFASSLVLGQTVGLDLFTIGERIDVTGTTKGRGFAGVIKRHGFHGGKKTHGSHSHRIPGSIGCSAWPAKVIRGKKMPGQYGNTRKTVRNLKIVDIRPEQNLMLIKGAVPGSGHGVVEIKKLKFEK